jgi:lipopolysaccharide biosynthesis glycosyltransferase
MGLKSEQVLAIGQREAGSLPVLFACDDSYAPYTAVTIASVYKHTTVPVDVTILASGFSAQTVSRFERIQQQQGHSLTILDVPDDVIEPFQTNHHWPKAACLRMAAPEIVERDRILYLDSDLLARASLQEVFASDLGECPVAGVPDFEAEALARAPHINWLGLPAGDPYINTGVMVMDLARLREERFLEKVHATQQSPLAAELRFGDQCLLNSVLAGRKALLDPRWNIHTTRIPLAAFHYLFVSGTRGIFHFCGVEKPWMDGASPSLRNLWTEYLALTDYTLDEVRRPSRPDNPAVQSILAEMRAAYFNRSSRAG